MKPVRAGLATSRIKASRPPALCLDFVAFGRRALIVPEQGRADHLAGCIEEHRAVHLAAQADAR